MTNLTMLYILTYHMNPLYPINYMLSIQIIRNFVISIQSTVPNDNGSNGHGPVSDSSPPDSNSSSSLSGSTSANKINKSGVIAGVTVTVIVISLVVLLIVLRKRTHGNYQQPLIIYCFLPLLTFIKS
ncbi:hypothetical protein FCM35_KLT01782 [Carex littledalei]|uniref:Uncharacterized protein n=1 Tax=Carex littledalei TaxID=544730 RepID=A0A833VM37_9POAL|nr:hypothetical protein FCM35_KLT01782 [Carex littledalei]